MAPAADLAAIPLSRQMRTMISVLMEPARLRPLDLVILTE